MSELQPTPEQAAAIDAVGTTSGPSVMLRAYAGAAKTTTLELSAKRVRSPALLVAFNKKIALEAQGRFPGNFQCKTLNGLGFQAWTRGLPSVGKWIVDERKLGKLVTQTAKEYKIELSSDQWDSARRLVSLAQARGLSPGDEGTPLVADTADSWRALADELWLAEDDFKLLLDLVRAVFKENNKMARAGVISFDDQIYCPTILGGRWPLFPLVFVDEAQDLSPLNHEMLQRVMHPGTRLVAVGDPRQAIYAFRGADSASMDTMQGMRGAWSHLPLATTFRCPKVIVARQQSHAPGFNAWSTNPEGAVHRLAPQENQSWTWSDVLRYADGAKRQGKDETSVAIICRNNAPLVSIAFKLIRGGIGVVMLGRDLGKGLVALSRKLAEADSTPIDTFRGLVADWEAKEISLAAANGQPERVAGITDRADCLRAVADQGARDVGELRALLERLFARAAGQVTLASGHKAKGLEWDCVLHLDPWRVPSRHAREAQRAGDPRAMEQEMNLLYVIETRTRHTLLLADVEAFAS